MAILVFEHGPHSGVMRLGEILRDCGQRLRVLQLHDGDDVPVDLDDVDGIVTCGGPGSSNDDTQRWLGPQMELLRAAHAIDLPIVGICLGSQILARALGGETGAINAGVHLGWQPVTLTPAGRDDPLHAGISWRSSQFHWNRDEVKELPDGARLLATADGCRVQSWVKGLRTYGFQYHPEILAGTIGDWIDDDPRALEEADMTTAALHQQTKVDFPAMRRLADRLFEHIALLLMPVDRRFAGLVKDLHH